MVSFADDPAACLSALAGQPPSREGLSYLAGTVALAMKDEFNPHLGFLYLQAVARHLVVETGAVAASAAAAAPAAAGGSSNDNVSVEMELTRTQQLYEIIEAVGVVVTRCSPRINITQSGILPALAACRTSSSMLSNAHVEFLQACLCAEQYRYAERMSMDSWPRPTSTVSVKQVLRYYYLRGMVHIGCNHWKWAVRCFWTCLSVQADAVSLIAVAAWKKMILVQCLIGETSPLALPQVTSSAFTTFTNLASSSSALPKSSDIAAAAAPEATTTTSSSSNSNNRAELMEIQNADAYVSLVRAFQNGDCRAFAKILKDRAQVFLADGNMGLANQCETELSHRRIFDITRIYSVISLDQLSTQILHTTPEQVKHWLTYLSIEKGLAVRLESDGTVVVFPEPHLQQPKELEINIPELISLTERVQKLEVSIATSSRFHSLIRKDGKNQQGPKGVEDF